MDDLLERARPVDAGDVAAVARLRKTWSADETGAALHIADARRRLAEKCFDADRWIADTQGAQMASDARVAAHKACRFAGADAPVLDLCCGIGADAHALAAAGVGVTGIDLDERRCVMARHNAGVPARAADAGGAPVSGALVHLDPSRRDGARRLLRLGDLVPGPGVIARLVSGAEGAAVKLMPGVNQADLADHAIEGELEYIALRGRLSQAVVWTGSLRRHRRSATMFDACNTPHTLFGEPREPDEAGRLGAWLFQPDPAAERAGLLAELAERTGTAVLHPALGLLTSDSAAESPWLTPFGVLDRMPWRADRVREALARLGAGLVEVKTRGGACDPDEVQRQLRGKGERPLTVFVLRFGAKTEAIIAQRP